MQDSQLAGVTVGELLEYLGGQLIGNPAWLGKLVEHLMIGAMSAVASPHWLGHEPLRTRRILHHELIWPDGRPNAALAAMPSQSTLQPSPSGASSGLRRSFRVLDGGRKED